MRMTTVIVTAVVSATHCWPDAIGDVEFLQHEHHHDFHLTVELEVPANNDREVEIIALRQAIRTDFVNRVTKGGEGSYWVSFGDWSCEKIANELLNWVHDRYGAQRYCKTTVLEDGVLGASVTTARVTVSL